MRASSYPTGCAAISVRIAPVGTHVSAVNGCFPCRVFLLEMVTVFRCADKASAHPFCMVLWIRLSAQNEQKVLLCLNRNQNQRRNWGESASFWFSRQGGRAPWIYQRVLCKGSISVSKVRISKQRGSAHGAATDGSAWIILCFALD